MTPLHRAIMKVVGAAAGEFGAIALRLEGGTALAAYFLHHRESEDLDFFAALELSVPAFLTFLDGRFAAAGLTARTTRAPIASFGEILVSMQVAAEGPTVKVQFAQTSPYQLAPLEETAEGVKIASYRDLCRGKMKALCGRFELRDYLDIHCIIRRPSGGETPDDAEARRRIRQLVADLIECDPGITPSYIGQAFARGRHLPALRQFPLRVLVPVTDGDLRTTVEACVEECAALVRELADVHGS